MSKVNKQGQGGPKIDINYVELTVKERLVLGVINESEGPITLGALAEICFRSEPKTKRNSWCRNQLRRLVRGGFVQPLAPGVYTRTAKRIAARKVA